MAGTHSRFAPSAAHRIVPCPGSLLPSEQEPDVPTLEAVQGTVSHYIHEHCLINNGSAFAFVGMHPVQFMPVDELTDAEWKLLPYSRGLKPDEDYIIDATIASRIDESVLRCRERPGDAFVEQRVDISAWCPVPDQGGTVDFFVCAPGLLDVTDLKDGMVYVDAFENVQTILYALGVIEEYDWLYDFDKVILRIHQPRIENYSTWETTKAELLKIGEYIKQRFALALEPGAPFNPTEHGCRYCNLAYKCAALREVVMGALDNIDEFSTRKELKDQAAMLSPEKQAEIVMLMPLINTFVDAVVKRAKMRMLEDPKAIPGLRLVNSRRTRRYWTDKQAAADELMFNDLTEDQIYKPRQMISPAQAEKLNKSLKPIISELVSKPLGKPEIVMASDPRPDYVGDHSALALEAFEVEDED